MKKFGGKILFLDRDDINTDEIIPAKYLTEDSKAALKPYLLEDLVLDSFNSKNDLADKTVIVTKTNFGCGSSREHAPWALEVNGITVVVASSYARIFRQNYFNGGMVAVELSESDINKIFGDYANSEAILDLDLDASKIKISNSEKQDEFVIEIAEFDLALVKAGGWVEYADKNY